MAAYPRAACEYGDWLPFAWTHRWPASAPQRGHGTFSSARAPGGRGLAITAASGHGCLTRCFQRRQIPAVRQFLRHVPRLLRRHVLTGRQFPPCEPRRPDEALVAVGDAEPPEMLHDDAHHATRRRRRAHAERRRVQPRVIRIGASGPAQPLTVGLLRLAFLVVAAAKCGVLGELPAGHVPGRRELVVGGLGG